MRRLINQLFTKGEIIDRQHEQINDKTNKIQGKRFGFSLPIHCPLFDSFLAIQACFFPNDADKFHAFWSFEGKIIRGNQRRGLAHRNKQTYAAQIRSSSYPIISPFYFRINSSGALNDDPASGVNGSGHS
jgi:hypothetical protein